MILSLRTLAVALSLGAWLAGITTALAQRVSDQPLGLGDELADIQLGPFGQPGPASGAEIEFHAFIVPAENQRPALLAVQATIQPGWHTYSLTQPPKGPQRTQIHVDESPDFRLLGPFQPTTPPALSKDEEIYPGIPLEKHRGVVTWVAPIEVAPSVDLNKLKITGSLLGQVCTDKVGSCKLFDFLGPGANRFTARLATPEEAESVQSPAAAQSDGAPSGEYAAAGGNPVIRGRIEPQTVQPGGKAKLLLTVEPRPQWHVYPYASAPPSGPGSRPTLIALTETSRFSPSAPKADSAIVEQMGSRYHEGPTTWTIELAVPADAQPGQYPIAGQLGYQVCSDATCLAPAGVKFEGAVAVGPQASAGAAPLRFADSSYSAAAGALASAVAWSTGATTADTAFDPAKLVIDNSRAQYSLIAILAMAFVGGLILNIMPCVLPVIGFKILGFFDQAGEHRAKALALNLWYSAGVIAVFLALATLGVVSKAVSGVEFGWGNQFNYPEFVIPMTAVLFVFALSMLGVWEIPVPGFVGSETADRLTRKEGPTGAFMTGMVTTIVATPCSAPFLGTALALVWALPWYFVYLTFFSMGLGLAAPYLVIGTGLASLKALPKPGAWMSVVKQVMGFLLFVPVVIFFLFIPTPLVVPTMGLLLGLGAACWMIGALPLTASGRTRAFTYAGAALVVVLLGVGSFAEQLHFGLFKFPGLKGFAISRFEGAVDRAIAQRISGLPAGTANGTRNSQAAAGEHKLPWEPYTAERLKELTAQGKTVMVDFTAQWCFTCKWLEDNVLNTKEVKEAVEANAVATLVADWTDKDPEMAALLKRLAGTAQVPVLAIFPADRPNQPIVFGDGGYRTATLLAALEKAGPSRNAAQTRTAMKTAGAE